MFESEESDSSVLRKSMSEDDEWEKDEVEEVVLTSATNRELDWFQASLERKSEKFNVEYLRKKRSISLVAGLQVLGHTSECLFIPAILNLSGVSSRGTWSKSNREPAAVHAIFIMSRFWY